MKREPIMKKSLSLLLCLLLALTALPVRGEDSGLPPYDLPFDAPENDSAPTRTSEIRLYLPNEDSSALVTADTVVVLRPFKWYAEPVLEALFSWRPVSGQPTKARSLPGASYLALNTMNPVEISDGIATVNLAASAMNLSHEELYTVWMAITDTLCQFGDIRGVNLLVGGIQPGIDVASQTPAGTALRQSDDLATLWARAESRRSSAASGKRITCDTTLYFPAYDGRGILCETRTLVFSSTTPPQMAKALLSALSEGPSDIHVPALPDLNALLTAVSISEDSGERVLSLRFDAALDTALSDAGISRACFCASLVYTMTTFLPGIAGLDLWIGDSQITSVTPEATYQGAGEAIVFTDGIMRRSQFAVFLLSQCTLYFADGSGMLRATRRAVPWYETRSPRFLLEQLILGSMHYDSVNPLKSVIPSSVSGGDILAVALPARGNCLLVSLTPGFLAACGGMTPDMEKAMVYAMVNTLTELDIVNEVCFFAGSEQADTFAGSIVMRGTFLRNVNMIRQPE